MNLFSSKKIIITDDTPVSLPKRMTGAAGPKGDTGAQGPKGDTGAQGPKGDTGAQGADGSLRAKLKPNIARYVIPGWSGIGGNIATMVPSDGVIYYIPIYVSETTTYTEIGFKVATYNHTMSFSIRAYAWNDGVPGALLRNFGSLSCDSTGTKKITGINWTLTKGYYFLAFRNDSSDTGNYLTSPLYASSPVQGSYQQSSMYLSCLLQVYSDWNDPAPAPTAFTGDNACCLFLREN